MKKIFILEVEEPAELLREAIGRLGRDDLEVITWNKLDGVIPQVDLYLLHLGLIDDTQLDYLIKDHPSAKVRVTYRAGEVFVPRRFKSLYYDYDDANRVIAEGIK
ncbi:MAG: hypothetical protein AABX66_03140 [Nanoarchaeota archaeon]|mgnify:CR=1 FL=1